MMTSPQWRPTAFLLMRRTIRPIRTAGRAMSVSPKAMIWGVTVVPMQLPKITLMACSRFMRPAFTKPTTMTVEALELCTMAVMTVPTTMPVNLFLTKSWRMLFSLAPATLCNPSDIMVMPRRKSARPPKIAMTTEVVLMTTDWKCNPRMLLTPGISTSAMTSVSPVVLPAMMSVPPVPVSSVTASRQERWQPEKGSMRKWMGTPDWGLPSLS